jgi:hypothetical protein
VFGRASNFKAIDALIAVKIHNNRIITTEMGSDGVTWI